MKLNSNYDKLVPSYLFAEIANKVNTYIEKNPEKNIIKLGIGDVTLPISKVVINAMKKGVEDLGNIETFKGYPDYEGYEFLRKAISTYYKSEMNVDIGTDEILVNDGAKSDCGNIGDIFSEENIVLVTDPVYPVYVDTNIMSGRKIVYANSIKENGFKAMPDESVKTDIIYLCSPNNPTGSVYTRDELKKWVDYANRNNAIILFDTAYESFITEDLPRSIFEIEGSRTCAIEFCSLSKVAGFTGVRCGYTVIPKELEREGQNIYKLWYRRQSAKFNGVSWPVQVGAAEVFTKEGQKQIKENIKYYQENSKIIAAALDELGIQYTGGKNSPYIWLECPNNMKSWEFFDYLLENANVVGTPGSGFGKNVEGYFRLTAFGSREATLEAVNRIKKLKL